MCSYTRLIAAYHVLRRLREPRHPSCALSYFLSLCRRATTQYMPLHVEQDTAAAYFQLALLFVFKCVNMSNIARKTFRSSLKGGEYRGRTDDLLHAMQAL